MSDTSLRDRIARLGLPEQKLFKEHYSMVSDTIRIYLESTYGVPMMERTDRSKATEDREHGTQVV